MNPLIKLEVVAAIIERGDFILLAQRDAQSSLAGRWEFPGGKVETGETQPAALSRELFEELNIQARVDDWIANYAWHQGERIIDLHAWRVSAFSGEITLRCHSQFTWVTPQQALDYNLAPADLPLLQAYIAQRTENNH
ncbi:pyrimidine (deoxy)nucleoside triphosphate diphosphatase [Serratia sp. M24T3]|uniref:pyrimidine (deoxy)nucleoside triphosphate diphosphatase n=1 Tax=Serratia sp. M24T3 TaxID=932213 RepID=UPI00025BB20B|nr:pyrimidine (deoxy)nucleoside triphosphate diphosphatase [Serratia sp. M24T3]EIC83438.1 pyrimidine (deoxy)nucleoside triphosphate pyrophosphohydrolase [Serratia sp. M24T3]